MARHPDAQLEVRRIDLADLADLASVHQFADGLAAQRGWHLMSTAASLWTEAERLTGVALPAAGA